MDLSALTSISPIDGRYRDKVDKLDQYFSEYALIRYRVMIEVEYFLALLELDLPELKGFPKAHIKDLRAIVKNFDRGDAMKIKATEKVTNHDVKAVEYFLKEAFEKLGLGQWKEFIHFGLTSQDINNTAIPLMVKDFLQEEYLPSMVALAERLEKLAETWKDIPMLARTHGQPASPTRLGKEIWVFIERLDNQLELLADTPICGKFGGATGNFNAHHVAYPEVDWITFGNYFLEEILHISRLQHTTQIEHYDMLAAVFDTASRINTILIDLCRDMWTYISMEYFRQETKKGEVGSSAMPHKVNPIDFENAEGNLGVANAVYRHLSEKLPLSRLQRDLTDSTVTRNIGVPFAHTIIAVDSLTKGLGKLKLNKERLEKDLEDNWMVVAEAIQTVLRRYGVENPYEKLKTLTRGNQAVSRELIHDFVDGLEIEIQIKNELKKITPANYTGVVPGDEE